MPLERHDALFHRSTAIARPSGSDFNPQTDELVAEIQASRGDLLSRQAKTGLPDA